ncbi:gelsolin repeat protein [Cooperia oncophora]
MVLAKDMAEVERQGHSKVHLLDRDWDTNEAFWSHFGGTRAVCTVTEAGHDDDNYWKETSNKLSLWRVSDVTGNMKVTMIAQGQVKRSQLNSKDSFVLDAGQAGIFVWIGKDCTLEERAQALHIGTEYIEAYGLPQWTSVTRVLESAEPVSFTQWFDEWVNPKSKETFKPLLFQVSDKSGGMVVEEIANYTQESLDGDDVMILDALNRIYVWVGDGAHHEEKVNAISTAEKYLAMGKLPRHQKTAIETIYQGKETPGFKKLFPSWDDKLFKSGERTVENMRKLLFN